MIPIICLVFLFLSYAFPQGDSSGYFNINSPLNIKKFADYLFCSDDYLRAALEYEKYLSSHYNDTAEFKIGLSYSKIGNYSRALEQFNKISSKSGFFKDARIEYFKSLFQLGDYYNYRLFYLNNPADDNKINNAGKLFYFSYLFTDSELPPQNDFLKPFDSNEQNKISEFYKSKSEPPYKSIAVSVVLSSLIPGSGKIYTGQFGDGIIAAIATGLCGYLAYDNFKAEHDFRGWVFAGLTAFFYAGNIYGSAASAQIYNAGIRFNFNNELKLYLNKRNYFTPEYEFCK